MVVALLLVRSLSEGLGLLLVLPLLTLAGATTSTSGLHVAWLPAFASPIFTSVVGALSIFLAAMLARATIGYVSASANARFLADYATGVRQNLYIALSRSNWLHLASLRGAHNASALTMQAQSVSDSASHLINLIALMLTAAVGVLVALAVSPPLTLLVLLATFILALPLLSSQRGAFRSGQATILSLQKLYDAVVFRMEGLKLAKTLAIETSFEEAFAATSSAHADALVDLRLFQARTSFFREIGSALILAGFLYAGLEIAHLGSASIVMLVLIFARLMPVAAGALSHAQYLSSGVADFAALDELEKNASLAAEIAPPKDQRLKLSRALELRDVNFSYSGQETQPTLSRICLRIGAGEAVGIIGLSGAGKSTLADVITGLIPPSSGDVFIDDRLIAAEDRPQWRASVAYIPQDAPMFNDTLRANLSLMDEAVSEADIWTCLETAHAADLVRRMPKGLDTIAGDRGTRLSGGERQRIRLASALLRRPALIVLDEATNALSPSDEAKVIEALAALRGAMTMIVIAHRAASIAWVDRLFLLQDGAIVGDGPPGELLEKYTQFAKEHSA
jgi:ATP-binding cassette subfamily C protein